MLMRRICGVPGSAVFLHIISQTARFYEKKNTAHRVYVFIFSTIWSETFLILITIERDMIKNVYRSSCKVPFFLSNFNET